MKKDREVGINPEAPYTGHPHVQYEATMERQKKEAAKKLAKEESAYNAEVEAARVDARRRTRDESASRKGFSSTILTGGLGTSSSAGVSRKSLLGQ